MKSKSTMRELTVSEVSAVSGGKSFFSKIGKGLKKALPYIRFAFK